jgi:23S rRNA pseudouridine1911/1915/1917 synthase
MQSQVSATETDAGTRLDKFLAEKITNLSRSKINNLIEQGLVTLNSKSLKASHKVHDGDIVTITIPEETSDLKPYDFNVPIVFEDDYIIVIDKPYALTVHPASKYMQDTLVNALIGMGKTLSCVDPNRPGVVHRLDKETSGLMVLAKSDEVHYNLVAQFRDRRISKIYNAIVWGIVAQDTLTVDMPMSRDSANRTRMKIGFIDSKDARTDVKVLKRFSDSTHVELKIHTGRTHQIRVHTKFLGYPIVGDTKYGPRKSEYKEMLLHACKLGFYHPKTEKYIEFSSSLPQRFTNFIQSRS